MNPLTPTPELLELAGRIVWFKEPAETLSDPVHFLTYAMKLGTVDDITALECAEIGIRQFREALDHAPAGILDPRSWTYWNLKCGRKIVPPLPVRKLDVA